MRDTIRCFVIAAAASGIGLTLAPARAHNSYLPLMPSATSPQRRADIAALTKWLAHTSGCDAEEFKMELNVSINTLLYYDFSRAGNRDLIVVASTCFSGSAGPDIHTVFSRDGGGGFIEHRLPDVDRKYYEILVGNRRNYDLSVDLSIDGGLLVATFYDQAERKESPLVVKYEWSGNRFIVESIIAPYVNDKR